MKSAACALFFLLPFSATALTFEFPGNASLQADEVTGAGRYEMPIGAWSVNGTPVLIGEGEVRQQAWRIDAPGLTNAQIARPLRLQLQDSGYEILFECRAEQCGGFDFRFSTDVLPAPAMFVDLGDYLYIATSKQDSDATDILSLFISRTPDAAFVQITRAGENAASSTLASPGSSRVRARPAVALGDFGTALERDGRVILSDLSFTTGSAQLGLARFDSLEKLASYLQANPNRKVALVGHTDSVGSLDGNIALSRRRAGSVLERLVSDYNVPRRQMEAQGMGYLSPIATNLTEEGREMNRRVEVIVTSTDN